jgi:hypothetical protein
LQGIKPLEFQTVGIKAVHDLPEVNDFGGDKSLLV